MQAYRKTWAAARAYAAKPGAEDPAMETLAGALKGDIKVHIH